MTDAERLQRLQRAIIALHDYGSREGATAAWVRQKMKADGFTAKEISEAAKKMGAVP